MTPNFARSNSGTVGPRPLHGRVYNNHERVRDRCEKVFSTLDTADSQRQGVNFSKLVTYSNAAQKSGQEISIQFTLDTVQWQRCESQFHPPIYRLYPPKMVFLLWILFRGSNGESHVSSCSKNPGTVCSHSVKIRDHWTEFHLGGWSKV